MGDSIHNLKTRCSGCHHVTQLGEFCLYCKFPKNDKTVKIKETPLNMGLVDLLANLQSRNAKPTLPPVF